jgi:HK97 family phage major capsid protein
MTDKNIIKMEAQLKSIMREAESMQTEAANAPLSPERATQLHLLLKEGKSIQDQVEAYRQLTDFVDSGKQMRSVTLPTNADGSRKSILTTPGHKFIASDTFRQWKAQGRPQQMGWVDAGGRLGSRIKLVGEEAVAFEAKTYDSATLSDLGTDAIIQMDRDPTPVRSPEPERLRIRDVFDSAPTTSDTIRYIRYTVTRGAAMQAGPGAAKAWLKITADPKNVSVETIAVLSKVTEQDIDDAPRLVSLINGEMSLDIKVKEEKELLWGTGNSNDLTGLFSDGDVPEFDRAAGGDTTIDTIRKMITDLVLAEVEPNFVAIHPLDWEGIELEKSSSTEQYIFALITDLRGPRIWSTRVVATPAMVNPTTNQRRVLVGDGIRGATIYDRNDIRLAIGYVDDDFARNLRSLRAEERLALAVKRPWAFEFAVTHGAES